MEKEQNIIKFLNTIDKREIGRVILVNYNNNSTSCKYGNSYIDFWTEIEYLPKYSNRTTTTSLSEQDWKILQLYLNTDVKILEYLEETDLTIQEIKKYIEEVDNCKIYKFHSFEIGKEGLIVRYFTSTNIKVLPKYRTVVKNYRSKVSPQEAAQIVFSTLRNGTEFYDAWKETIVTSILKTREQFLKEHELKQVPKELEYSLANKAAKHFLNILTDDRKS